MRQLQDLLHESVASPPADTLDLGSVVQAGRRRVRHRRGAVLAGASVGVAAATAGSLLLFAPGLGTSGRIAPAGGTEPVGPVVELADAVGAVAGKDYTVLTTLTNENLDLQHPNGQYYQDVTPDGLIVLEDGPHGPDNKVRVGLLDPHSQNVSWLPEPPSGGGLGRLMVAHDRWLVWTNDAGDPGTLGFTVFDRTTEEWRDIPIDSARVKADDPDMAFVGHSVLGPDDRVYFTVSEGGEQARLWSVSLRDPGDLRQVAVVGDYDIDGDLLTYTEYTNRPSSNITVLDLRTGEETGFDARSGSRCNSLGMDRLGATIVLFQFCGRENGVRDDRIQVIFGTGEPILTIRGSGVELGALTSRYITLMSYDDKLGGSYAYDRDSGELLRLSRGSVNFDSTLEGHGSLLTWASPVNKRHGMKLWAAEFD